MLTIQFSHMYMHTVLLCMYMAIGTCQTIRDPPLTHSKPNTSNSHAFDGGVCERNLAT